MAPENTTDSVAQERESFQLPAKGRSSKSKTFVTTAQTELSNRYECLEDLAQIDDDCCGESDHKSPLIGLGRNPKFYQTSLALSPGSKPTTVSPDYSEMTRSEEEVIPSCSKDTEDNKREKGTWPLMAIIQVSFVLIKVTVTVPAANLAFFISIISPSTVKRNLGFQLSTFNRVSYYIFQYTLTKGCVGGDANGVQLIDNG